MRVLGSLAVVCLLAGSARADGAAERVATGEDLAKQGRLTEAIESFKAADKLEKRAKHACLIALAYIRRELWPQAEVFLTLCHERANAGDPVPDWVPLAEQQLKERLAKVKVAPVHIRILPTSLTNQTMIAVSSWEPDELFAPRSIHLPRGKHLLMATAPGKEPAQQTLEITDDAPREVVIDFEHKTETGVMPTPRLPAGPKAEHASRVPWIVMGSGLAITLAGAGYHAFAFKAVRDDLAKASAGGDAATYDRLSTKFDSRRTTTIALYGVGGAVLIGGAILHYTVFKNRKEAPRASAAVSRDRALVVMEWQR